jgi:hypothetical protein
MRKHDLKVSTDKSIRYKYVYIIQKLTDCTFKIGVSKHPKQRLKELQTGNEGELKLFDTYLSEYANKIEGTLHRQYSYCEGKGEWFDLSLPEANEFVERCRNIENNIIILKENGNVFI